MNQYKEDDLLRDINAIRSTIKEFRAFTTRLLNHVNAASANEITHVESNIILMEMEILNTNIKRIIK
jgi:hypothetical protein